MFFKALSIFSVLTSLRSNLINYSPDVKVVRFLTLFEKSVLVLFALVVGGDFELDLSRAYPPSFATDLLNIALCEAR